MVWYELLILCFFLGVLLALAVYSAFLEYKRFKAYKAMLEQREKYYFWGTEWYYRECGGTE